ncbi:MAG: DNA translocase FtsK [Dehalococcoidales bacterium]|jgi:S-DNA-T family DNA segregation ATPase FtsK/SpoIIIE
MVRKKAIAASKSQTKNRPLKQHSSGGFQFLTSGPFWYLVLLFIIVALGAVFREQLATFFANVRAAIGWGLAIIVLVIVATVIMAFRRTLKSFITYWNVWLGVIAGLFAVWVLLGLIHYKSENLPNGLGGSFGFAIAGSPSESGIGTFTGILCILGFSLLGVVFILPRPSLSIVNKFFGWLWSLTGVKISRERPDKEKRQPLPRPIPTNRPSYEIRPVRPSEFEEPEPPPEVTKARKKQEDLPEKTNALKNGVKPVEPATAPRSDLRQVAGDVWKKYGKSSDLVIVDGWSLPPVEILDTAPEVQFTEADNQQRAKLIEETLVSYGVNAAVVEINAGPTVTQFGVEPGWDIKYREIREKDKDGKVQIRKEEVSRTRVKVERISSLSNDLALALAAPTIRIEAPVPGKSYIGVEVPNTTSDMVSLRGVVETSAFQKLLAKTKMAVALGKGAGGEAIAADLTKMPHLLIAGATGSGKTVCLNTIVVCLMLHNTPNDVRFILIDPKRVELTQYNSIPHLATPVIVDTEKALSALRWLCQEMDQRYQKLAAAGARHIEGYNKDRKGGDKLPYLVLIIDELADLMMAGYDEVETNLCRLAQLARATGIHLVVATQRPSVDVVTGLIKANFPTRISFAVTSQVDSRTILDGAGAEKLLGRGDMLFMPTEAAKPKRLQGCFLSDAEIERLVYFWGSQKKEEPDKLKLETLIATTPSGTIGGFPRDPLLEQAKELAKQYDDVSTSFLQRKLHIGYPRAARLKDQLDAVLSEQGDVAESKAESVDEETGEEREDVN